MTDTGWHSPSAVQSSNVTNPANAFASDNLYATRTGVSGGKEEPYGLLLLKGYGFAVPETDVIVGIEAKIEGKKSGTIVAQSLTISTNGTGGVAGSTNKGSTFAFGSVDTESIVGGPADLWNISTLTPSVVNSPNFGIWYQGRAGASSTWYIDTISMKVYHEPSPVTEFEVSGDLDIMLSGDGHRSNAYRRALRRIRSIFPQRFSRR